jgi:hypothetical protein
MARGTRQLLLVVSSSVMGRQSSQFAWTTDDGQRTENGSHKIKADLKDPNEKIEDHVSVEENENGIVSYFRCSHRSKDHVRTFRPHSKHELAYNHVGCIIVMIPSPTIYHWRCPDEIHHGYTQDISPFRFHMWEPIWYMEKHEKAPPPIGCDVMYITTPLLLPIMVLVRDFNKTYIESIDIQGNNLPLAIRRSVLYPTATQEMTMDRLIFLYSFRQIQSSDLLLPKLWYFMLPDKEKLREIQNAYTEAVRSLLL